LQAAPGLRNHGGNAVGQVAQLSETGWPVRKSLDPGRFLCNYTYFRSLSHCTSPEGAGSHVRPRHAWVGAARAVPWIRTPPLRKSKKPTRPQFLCQSPVVEHAMVPLTPGPARSTPQRLTPELSY
jgi:hypothetical protein